ncbi:MAG: imidazolonepropionase [Anaerolineaceae bacterium]
MLIYNISQLLALTPEPQRGSELGRLNIIENGAVLVRDGMIEAVGKADDLLHRLPASEPRLDAGGKVVLPGFVDPHTHLVWAGDRAAEFEMRLQGKTYMEIMAAGGGIASTVKQTRAAAPAELLAQTRSRAVSMFRHGTTTAEAKSGYGLETQAEITQLTVLLQLDVEGPLEISPTFLGAHAIAPEYKDDPEGYTALVCDQMLPAVKVWWQQNAGRRPLPFVDVFCDCGAFSAGETVQIFAAAKVHGLAVRAHVGQLSETRLGPLLQYQPASLDHMDHVNDADLPLLAETDTVATFVPGANYFLGFAKYPNARRFIESGAAVALATDYNPGSSPTLSMPMALSLACTHMKMSPAEAIAAATINGAWALRLAERKGSVEPGKDADLAAFDVSDYREIPYWFGANRCALTIMNGVPSGHLSL